MANNYKLEDWNKKIWISGFKIFLKINYFLASFEKIHKEGGIIGGSNLLELSGSCCL